MLLETLLLLQSGFFFYRYAFRLVEIGVVGNQGKWIRVNKDLARTFRLVEIGVVGNLVTFQPTLTRWKNSFRLVEIGVVGNVQDELSQGGRGHLCHFPIS